MDNKFCELVSKLVGRKKFTTKISVCLTIDCLYLYFGMCAEIFESGVDEFAKNANSIGRKKFPI